MKTFAAILILSSTLWASAVSACAPVTFENADFTVCAVSPETDDVRLFLNGTDGDNLGTFDALKNHVNDMGRTLVFAMNAGMYHPDRSPVGLYVENGETLSQIVTRDGPGNFGLLPNGVLCLGPATARILESRTYDRTAPDCTYATQSGPMLVIDGALHPRFIADSDSTFRRNGAGVAKDGTLYLVISDGQVNFHHFARLFRDVLQTPNALFFDGKVSRLYAPALNRSDFGFPLGPMIGVVQ